MKALHRPDLFGWTQFNEELNLDSHSLFWVRHEGNVVVDPVHATDHDLRHMAQLGGVSAILLTCSGNLRESEALSEMTGAKIYAPSQARAQLASECDEWLEPGPSPFHGLEAIEIQGPSNSGELAYLLDGTTLLIGDFLRGTIAGSLSLLSPDQIRSHKEARSSLQGLASLEHVEAVWVANGWPLFHRAAEKLNALVADLR